MESEELFSSSVDGVCLAAKDEVTGASRMVSSERTNCFFYEIPKLPDISRPVATKQVADKMW